MLDNTSDISIFLTFDSVVLFSQNMYEHGFKCGQVEITVSKRLKGNLNLIYIFSLSKHTVFFFFHEIENFDFTVIIISL